ncbi:hypothetical protein BGW39_005003 [Mortierella sp. 14UC]|nr:hypothetical protein BGW39_005003 [Mortierella sp. 14UC]
MAKSSNTRSNSRRTNSARSRKVLSEEDVNKAYERDDSPAEHATDDNWADDNWADNDDLLEEEEEEEEEKEYEVERVVGHMRKKGVLQYRLKWNGYGWDSNTWEKEVNVHCEALVEEYWQRVEQRGGSRADSEGEESEAPLTEDEAEDNNASRRHQDSTRRDQVAAPKKRQTGSEDDDDEYNEGEEYSADRFGKESRGNRRGGRDKVDKIDKRSTKRARSREDTEQDLELDSELDEIEENEESRRWTPPESWTTWGSQIDQIRTIMQSSDNKLRVYLRWKNGRETDHPLEVAHDKFPLTLIRYYESHLRFLRVVDREP